MLYSSFVFKIGLVNPTERLTTMFRIPSHFPNHLLTTLFTLSTSLFFMASAQAASVEDAFRSFSKCDGNFFKSENVAALNPSGSLPTEQRGQQAWLKASNNQPLGDAELSFPQQPDVAGVRLLSYTAGNSDLDSMGLYYFWGFVASGDIIDVTEKLRPLIYQNDRLRKDGAVFVRTEAKIGSSNWINIALPGSTAAGTIKIERTFIIEKGGTPGTVAISCTLQGGVTPELLASDRPDLDLIKYPRSIDPGLFEKTSIPQDVALQISKLVNQQPKWKPQFHTLRYTQQFGKTQVRIEHRADGNYLQTTETYSPEFNVKRTSWANFVQIKSMLNIGQPGKTVRLATNAKLNVPKILTDKRPFSVSIESENTPPTDGKSDRIDLTCRLNESQPAQKINAALSGPARIFTCIDGDKKIHHNAFIENLGIILTMSTKSPNEKQVNYQFENMVIDR